MLQRQLCVLPRGLNSRREILLDAGNKAFERLGKILQEGEYRRALHLAFHQREAHQVQAQVGNDGGRNNRLAKPVQVGGVARRCH